ncbi:MAG: (2Fe-2S)-binding protein [Pseudomonadota bacterium]
MFVCICNALNDRTVNELVASGAATSAAGIHRAAGCKVQCGRCLPDMAEIIAEHKTAGVFAQAAD